MAIHLIRNARTGEEIPVEAETREQAIALIKSGWRPPGYEPQQNSGYIGPEALQGLSAFKPEPTRVTPQGAQQPTPATAVAPPTQLPTPTDYAGMMLTGAKHFGKGASFGFLDELEGQLYGRLPMAIAGGDEALRDQAYREARDASRQDMRASAKAEPWSAGIGEFAGGASVPIPGSAWLRGASGGISTAARMAGQGLGAGLLQGVGESEGETFSEIADDSMRTGLLGAVAAPAIGGVLGLARTFGLATWYGLTESAQRRAERIIRSRAAELDIDADQILAQLRQNPNFTMADIDDVFTKLAAGIANRQPSAEGIARTTLNARQAAAPDRIEQGLRQTSRAGQPTQRQVQVERMRGKRDLRPTYEALSSETIDLSQPQHAQLVELLRLMPDEYRLALTNWQRRNGAPGVDPVAQYNQLPGDMIQELKTLADQTIGSVGDTAASKRAALALKEMLLAHVDPHLPSMAPSQAYPQGLTYPELRDEWARRVGQPGTGLKLGQQTFSTDVSNIDDLTREVGRLLPEGKEAFRAAAIERARREAASAAGTGDQFAGGPLLRRGELSEDRLALALGNRRGARDMMELLGQERTMHTTRATVLPRLGSKTGYLQQATEEAGELSAAGGALVGHSSVMQLAEQTLALMHGESPEVSRQIMSLLMRTGATEADVRSLMSGTITRNMSEAFRLAAPMLTQLARGYTASRAPEVRAGTPQESRPPLMPRLTE